MRIRDFLIERAGWIFGIVCQVLLVMFFGVILEINRSYLILIFFLEMMAVVPYGVVQFHKKKRFYKELFSKLEELDKKYLITDVIEKPGFLEGNLFCEALYEIDRSMNERVGEQRRAVRDFREYVELWIHEIKLPLSALSLMTYNETLDFTGYRRQLEKISGYLEQILYYVRSDAPSEDYLMKKSSLETMINQVLANHKQALIEGHFTIEKAGTELTVTTDTKWFQFMLGQLVNNSVKYKKGKKGHLRFSAEKKESSVVLTVEDRGIGVPAADVGRVFDKSFTGENGRTVSSATGMGLFICKRMCRKLGHRIWMESEQGRYTKVMIEFGEDGYYLENKSGTM